MRSLLHTAITSALVIMGYMLGDWIWPGETASGGFGVIFFLVLAAILFVVDELTPGNKWRE